MKKIIPILFVFLAGVCSLTVAAQEETQKASSNQQSKPDKESTGMDVSKFDSYEGFFNFLWDEDAGKVWLQVDGKIDKPFLYVTSLATGLGSNPVGLDRGQLGSTKVVRWLKVGGKVYLEHRNLKYRASSTNRSEQKAVDDSFADSIIWSGEIKKSEDGRTLVDITSLIVRDAHQSASKLSSTGQGKYSFDKGKSFVYVPRLKAFPKNSELEAAVTLTSSQPGSLARRTAASGNAITLRQHHSFVELPDNQFRPRKYDPRSGSFSVSYQDYSVPIDQNIERRFVTRHRLSKRDPGQRRSAPVEPIVYYVDSGVPSPIKEALIEGASWWNEAFEAAGYIDAFQVRELPEDADPMDVRYNVIQWVHRATRGWSYGQSVVDPRTGEIIKGHVLLGSLRVRQDLTLMNGFAGKRAEAQMAYSADRSSNDRFCSSCQEIGAPVAPLARLLSRRDGLEVALARIRQLSAHEVGHTLGFAHNFAASTYGDRASVMDYPAPRTRIVAGKIDLSDAYGVGIGSWDKFMVQYSYTQFESEKEESKGLNDLIADAIRRKMIYISDADSRPSGAAHPLASLWDNGSDPIKSLQHEIAVRKIALLKFSEELIDVGEPLTELEKSFVPIYLHHRYQVDATSKMVGGVEYSYAVRGDNQTTNQPVPIAKQKEALEVLLSTLEPEFLTVPEKIQKLIPPKPYSSASDRERFSSRTSPIFDSETAIEVAAELTLGNLLQPQRLSRVGSLNDKDWNMLQVIDRIKKVIFATDQNESLVEKRSRRIVQNVFVDRLIKLATNDSTSVDVNSTSHYAIEKLRSELSTGNISRAQAMHNLFLREKIDRFLNRNDPNATPRRRAETPPGSPIGENQ